MVITTDDAFEQPDQRRLEHSLRDRPVQYQRLIELRNFGGATWEDLAVQTGHHSPEVARRAHERALIALGKRLRAHGGGEGERPRARTSLAIEQMTRRSPHAACASIACHRRALFRMPSHRNGTA